MSAAQLCLDPACLDGAPLDDGSPGPRLAKEGLLCGRCCAMLERRVAEMPSRAEQLRGVLAGEQRGTGGGSRAKPGSKPPLNVSAHDHLQQMHAVAVSWVRLVCEERDLRGPDRNHLDALAPWLLSQLDWITGQGWVGDLADEMRDAARTADGITRAQPAWHRLEAPCPDCAAQELGRWDGEDSVVCAACGRDWPERDYPRLVQVIVADLTLSSREAAGRLGLKYGSFRNLVSEEGVTLRPFATLHGEARYLAADVDALAAEREDCA